MSASSGFAPPVAVSRGAEADGAPLVVLLHGRGSDAGDFLPLAGHLPVGPAYLAVRAPIAEAGGFAWFANRGVGRPVAASLRATMDWFQAWLDGVAPPGRPVVLVGFSGGAAFAGGLLLDDPARYAGTALLYGTLPFDAGLDTTPGRLSGAAVFLAHGEHDTVIPPDLLERTWTYLHHGSGATLLARRDPVGHGIAGAALAALSDWLIERMVAASDPPVVGPDSAAWAGPAHSGGDE